MKMLTKTFAASALAVAGAGLAVPASAAVQTSTAVHAPAAVHSPFTSVTQWSDMSFEHKRKRGRHYRDRDDYGRRGYDEPVYRDTRVWRDRDGTYRCRKTDGTIGMIVGGAAGAILGREIDSRGDRTLGTVLGAAGGAILGKEVMSRTRCR